MKNLSSHRASYLRALFLIETELAIAVSVVCPVVPSFSPEERAWFRAPLKGGK